MRNAAICLSFVLALTACASTEEPVPTVEQAEAVPPKADPLESAPAFAIATLTPSHSGCTAESTRDRAIVGIQTEAMMTALACGRRYGNPNAYADYRSMTATHAELIAAATRAIIGEYGKGKEGVRKFDIEHTRVSNRVAMTANGGNQASYCEPRREWFEALLAADRDRLSRHAALVADAMCKKQIEAELPQSKPSMASGDEVEGAARHRT